MSKTLEKEGPSICAKKTRHNHCYSPTAVATTDSTLLDQSSVGNFCPRRSLVSAHQMCPSIFQMKIFGCGCSRECIQMAWWQKNWQDREQWQNFFSRKSENLYKEKFHTPRKNLAEYPIEVHSSVSCRCHQNRMTTGSQWTPKSKGSFFVTCHYSKTKVVSIFMQHTVVLTSISGQINRLSCALTHGILPFFLQCSWGPSMHWNFLLLFCTISKSVGAPVDDMELFVHGAWSMEHGAWSMEHGACAWNMELFVQQSAKHVGH